MFLGFPDSLLVGSLSRTVFVTYLAMRKGSLSIEHVVLRKAATWTRCQLARLSPELPCFDSRDQLLGDALGRWPISWALLTDWGTGSEQVTAPTAQ